MSSEPGYLRRVERWTLILAAIVVAVSFVAAPRPVAFAATVGAGLMCLNAVAIRALTERLFKSRGGATPGFGVLLFNFKMAILIALIWIAMRYLHLDGVGFIVGVSVFPVAIVVAAIALRLEPADDADGQAVPPPHAPLNPGSGDR